MTPKKFLNQKPQLKKWSIRVPKVKNVPKIKSKSKAEIEVNKVKLGLSWARLSNNCAKLIKDYDFEAV